MKKSVSILFCAALLAGCQTPSGPSPEAVAAGKAIQTTCDTQMAQFDGSPVRAKIMTMKDDNNVGFDKLTIAERPTAAERETLMAMANIETSCMSQFADWTRANNPQKFTEAMFLKTSADAIWLDLLQDKLTYGEANQRIKGYREEAKARQADFDRKYAEEQARRRQAELAAFGAALQDAGNQLNAASAPPPGPGFAAPMSPRIETCRFTPAGPNAIRRQCY
jgi:hypothetical protein